MERHGILARSAMVMVLLLGTFAGSMNAQQAAQVAMAEAGATAPAGKRTFRVIVSPFRAYLIGISDSGELLATDGQSGFVYRNGDTTITAFEDPGTGIASANPIAINNKNQVLVVAGGYYLYDTVQKTFSPISQYARIKGVDNSGGSSNIGSVSPAGFNDVGQFIGTSSLAGSGIAVYGTLDVGRPGSKLVENNGVGTVVKFGCPDEAQTIPTAINNHGQIVGTCQPTRRSPIIAGFLYATATGMMKVFSYPGARLTKPIAINDAGLIVLKYEIGTGPPIPPTPDSMNTSALTYDGSVFTHAALSGGETPKLTSLAGFAPTGMNNHGDIVGQCFLFSSFIAMAGDRRVPQMVEILSAPSPRKRSYPQSKTIAALTKDPNLPGLRFDGPLSWDYERNSADTVPDVTVRSSGREDEATYLGFDDVHGSLVEVGDGGYIYAYNGKTMILTWIARGIGDLPEAVIAGLKNPSDKVREMLGERALESTPLAKPLLKTVHGENGKITTGADGKSTLTYVLYAPADPTDGNHMSFPVVRPVVKTISILPPLDVPPTGNTGNWIWQGDAEHPGVAAVFALDSGGIVGWNFISPDFLAIYMGKNSPGGPGQPGMTPAEAQAPATTGEIAGTGATVRGGILSFTLANHSKATYKVVRPRGIPNAQGADISGAWIAVKDDGDGILFTVLADNSVTGKEVPAMLLRALM